MRSRKPRRPGVVFTSLAVLAVAVLSLDFVPWPACAAAAKKYRRPAPAKKPAEDPQKTPAQPPAVAPAVKPDADTRRAQAVDAAVAQARQLLDAGKADEASRLLVPVRKALGAERDPRVEGLLAAAALALNQPLVAIELAEPFAKKRRTYDPALTDCYFAAANAYLATGLAYEALALFDWMAGKAQGLDLILAAEGCGRALLARKDFQKAVASFRFALNYAKRGYDYPEEIKKIISRLEDQLAEAERLADVARYGEEFVRYRDAERLRRVQQKFAEARKVYLEIVEKWPETVYAEASRLYAAKCLVAMGKTDEAKRELHVFRQSDPYGLYRGEAAIEMGRIALEHDLVPQAARGAFLLAETWLREVQNQKPLNVDRLAVPQKARQVTAPPRREKSVDFWGNVKKNEIEPGGLVNRHTCPWYLDDLKEQCAMYLGFLAFVDGRKDEALAQYKKILECDPTTRRMDTQGEWNDYSRLKWGAEHGYLIAYPQELALYSDRQRLSVLLGDFHYVTQNFKQAAAVYESLLKGKCGVLRLNQRDYPLYALGLATYRGDRRPGRSPAQEAVALWEKVLERTDGTWTEYRAAYTIANLSRQSVDPSLRARGRQLLGGLAQSPVSNEFTQKARLAMAMDLAQEGQQEATLALLGRFKESDGKYYALAQHLIKNGGRWVAGDKHRND